MKLLNVRGNGDFNIKANLKSESMILVDLS
ncbi:hypothetical protein EV200_101767 [Pedobacter psychrotolerans]|uniref:Uncharacterized protein n=1 Tax=Pedobacter psychrotolerans TaxID=1843235 RepID=A0A4R2HM71_9SPHI|nr:hypothetical protein EV200_101767 [Pedobacter psychrotolerans]